MTKISIGDCAIPFFRAAQLYRIKVFGYKKRLYELSHSQSQFLLFLYSPSLPHNQSCSGDACEHDTDEVDQVGTGAAGVREGRAGVFSMVNCALAAVTTLVHWEHVATFLFVSAS